MLIAPSEVRLRSRGDVEKAVRELERRLGPSRVDTSETGRTSNPEADRTRRASDPAELDQADEPDELSSALTVCEHHRVPVTPRAAVTGRTGGAVPMAAGIVLATDRLSRIVD